MMNARTMTPAPPMPTYVEAPWARPAFTPPPVPDPWKNHAIAKLLWIRLFADDQDASRPAWPTATQWTAFPQVIEMIDAISELDRRWQQEADAKRRDLILDEILQADADVALFCRQHGFARHFLKNVAGDRRTTGPLKPDRELGEDLEAYSDRLAAWRRGKSMADV